jgi:hypothetical protein
VVPRPVYFEGFDGFSARNDGLERGAEFGNIPLAVDRLHEIPMVDFAHYNGPRYLLGLILDSKNTILPEAPPRCFAELCPGWGTLSVM